MPDPPWLILLYSLPASHAAERLSLWRQLKRLGAVSLKTSAYILPQRPEHEEALQWLAQKIRQDGGEASLLKSAQVETLSTQSVKDLFQDARRTDYEEILTAAAALKGPRKNRAAGRLDAKVQKLRRQYLAVRRIDFFACPAAEQVRAALDELLPKTARAARKAPARAADYQKRVWQTRPRPELDRMASAWLIRRFIDPKATFAFGAERLPRRGTVTFDMVDADFGHEGDDCTFETLVRRFSLKKPGLAVIAEIIHAADIEDGRFPRAEGLGLLAVLRGWAALGVPDEEILRRGSDLMDGLLQSIAAGQHG